MIRLKPLSTVSHYGLETAAVQSGSVILAVFFRTSLNFGLVHNGVSPLAGIGLLNLNEEQSVEVESLFASLSSFSDEQDAWIGPRVALKPKERRLLDPAELAWSLQPEAFAHLREAVADSLLVEFQADGSGRSLKLPLRLLAREEWDATTVPELLAAYVRPRSAAITELLSRTAERLREQTGDPSLVGYQMGSERLEQTVRAMFEVVKDAEVRYSMPPASFEATGQKIRTPDEVLETRFGTCLDTTVLFAALAEEAGLNPAIIVFRTHATVAVFTEEIGLHSFAETTREGLSNIFGSSLFLPWETTAATDGKGYTFDQARGLGEALFRNDQALYLLDVRSAHRRVRPLPEIREVGGVVHIEKIIEAQTSRRQAPVELNREKSSEGGRTLESNQYPPRVQRWRSNLLDLTLRNPLLNLPRRRAVNLLVSEPDLSDLEDDLADGRRIRLTPSEDVARTIEGLRGNATANQLTPDTLSQLYREEGLVYAHYERGSAKNRLNVLRRESAGLREETGANSLYVAVGNLRWADRAGNRGEAPLFLVPALLEGSAKRPFEVRVEPGTQIQANYCLIEKLRAEHGIELPLLENPYLDESGLDIDRIFVELREHFLREGLDFSVEARADLAILQFASLDLWRDVSENWERLAESRVVSHLIETPGEIFQDNVEDPIISELDEVETYLPVPADGSQLQAIKATSAGRTFVLEGPPGTGKSQTITNMIADGLMRGRKILFVAEKQAALSVVHDRLKAVGLEDLVLEVHGANQTLNSVRDQLGRSLKAEKRPNTAAFENLQATLRRHIEELASYPNLVHSSEGAESIWEQYQRCLSLEQDIAQDQRWSVEAIQLGRETLQTDKEELLQACRGVVKAQAASGAVQVSQAWAFIGSELDEPHEWEKVVETASALAERYWTVPDKLRVLLRSLDDDTASKIEQWFTELAEGQAALPAELSARVPELEALVALCQRGQQHFSQYGSFSRQLTARAFTEETSELRAELREAKRAGVLKRRRLERAALDEIELLVTPDFSVSVRQEPLRFLDHLESFLREEQQFFEDVRHIDPKVPPQIMASPEIVAHLQHLVQWRRSRAEAAQRTESLFSAIPNLQSLVEPVLETATVADVCEVLTGLRAAWERLTELAAVTPQSCMEWSGGKRWAAVEHSAQEWSLQRTEAVELQKLHRHHELRSSLRRLEGLGLSDAAEAIAAGKLADGLPHDVELARERELLEESLRRVGLDVFDQHRRNEAVNDYLKIARQIKERMQHQLPAVLLNKESRIDAASVGLRKEIDRRRGGSIRALFDRYGSEVLELTPCILMSPSSVARFLSVEAVEFDTVIFDEASQIPVADAVGALGRAKAAVIVGDSKQMPPTRVFGPSMAEPDEEGDDQGDLLAVTDQESILSETVAAGFGQKLLSWHYRSKDESLITFSNHKYYRGELSVFPSPPETRPGLGVSAHFVGGVFERGKERVNRHEATVITERITSLLEVRHDASIGVVTFNSQQRDLILDLLEQSESDVVRRALERDRESLFVKNLENVQGDERDLILFSLAFSRDPESGRLPLNFGPLNAAGGERRLNVAVTRARSAIELYSSFTSADIDLSRTRAEGIRHLKEYLAYAESAKTQILGASAGNYDLYREELHGAFSSAGMEVQSDIGTSKFRVDLAVRSSPDHGWLAVMLDSPEWAQRQTIGDREALPGEILQKVMGWQATAQLLMPEWKNRGDAVVEDIRSQAESLFRESSEDLACPTSTDLTEIENLSTADAADWRTGEPEQELHQVDALAPMEARPVETIRSVTTPSSLSTVNGDDVMEFLAASQEEVGSIEVLDALSTNRGARQQVREQLARVIEEEGPVEAGRLAKLVAARFGLARVKATRTEEILRCAAVKPVSNTFGRFYWPDGMAPESFAAYRTESAGDLEIDQISAEEIANAMALRP